MTRVTHIIGSQVHHYQPQLPSVEVSCEECPVTVGKVTRVKLSFWNILARSLSRLLFLVQAQGLCPQRELAYRLVATDHRQGSTGSTTVYILSQPQQSGTNCNELPIALILFLLFFLSKP